MASAHVVRSPSMELRQAGTVTFDVRGTLVKVLPELICSKGSTLLAQLIQDVGTDVSQPIFVDANPYRFEHILDWYRYGEMFPTIICSMAALLRDADYFLLPETVIINGEKHKVQPGRSTMNRAGNANTADRLRSEYIQDIITDWPNFDSFFQERLAEIRGQIKAAATGSGDAVPPPDGLTTNMTLSASALLELATYDYSSSKHEWIFPGNLHNNKRAEAFAAKLEECGFECQVVSTGYNAPWTLSVRLPRQSSTDSLTIKQPVLVQQVCASSGKLVCSGQPCFQRDGMALHYF